MIERQERSILIKMRAIAVVGSSNIDMVTYTTDIPKSGETVIGKTFSINFGGKGANQALMASRFSADVYMVTGVGSDSFGSQIIDNLRREGINSKYLHKFAGSTGVAPIWVDGSGANRIIVFPGANNLLEADQAIVAIKNIKNLGVVVGQLEILEETTLAAFKSARELGITTILNPAPAKELSKELLENTDWLIPNSIEYQAISGSKPTKESICKFAKKHGIGLVVTLGENGAALVDRSGKYSAIKSEKVSALDTTGAGDCFVGAFAASINQGFSPESAAKIGTACATSSVTREGAQSSYPNKVEVRKLIKELVI